MAFSTRVRRWSDAAAPSVEEIGALADDAYRSLPEPLLSLAGQVVICIEDFPDEDTLEELGCESGYDLLGLYRGIDITRRCISEPELEPNTVYLYRRAIIDYWAEHEETLGDIITHVVVHEIGHHLGLSDDDMAKAEREAGARITHTMQ